ncbi:MAG: hypothetical protein LUD76_10275 [Alistipes sp.]|nr:hypothetical protein [Alistipes sp.]
MDVIRRPTGRLSLIEYDTAGNVLWSDTGHNLIVASGYDAIAQSMNGNPGAAVSHVAIGTRGDAPQDSDTEITDAVRIDFTSVEYPADGCVRYNFRIPADTAVGVPIREFGLITADGRLFSRKTRETIDKAEYMSLVGAWFINF